MTSSKKTGFQSYDYTIDHYELLKNMVKLNTCGGEFEEEKFKIKHVISFMFRPAALGEYWMMTMMMFSKGDNCLFCFYKTLENTLDIRLMSGKLSNPDFEWFTFNKCRNTYVFQNLREIVSVG